jgi:hypothetical protein
MPYTVKHMGKGKGYAIVNKATGKTVGHSATKAKAKASIRARMAHEK